MKSPMRRARIRCNTAIDLLGERRQFGRSVHGLMIRCAAVGREKAAGVSACHRRVGHGRRVFILQSSLILREVVHATGARAQITVRQGRIAAGVGSQIVINPTGAEIRFKAPRSIGSAEALGQTITLNKAGSHKAPSTTFSLPHETKRRGRGAFPEDRASADSLGERRCRRDLPVQRPVCGTGVRIRTCRSSRSCFASRPAGSPVSRPDSSRP